MITEHDPKASERNVTLYIQEGLLKRDPSNIQFAPFYLNNAKMSLLLANHLQTISTNAQAKKQAGFPQDYECMLWVVVISYYSMFYMANAALARIGLKVGDKLGKSRANQFVSRILVGSNLELNRFAITVWPRRGWPYPRPLRHPGPLH